MQKISQLKVGCWCICFYLLSFSTIRGQSIQPILPPHAFHLDTLEYRTFRWFWDLAHGTNFQIPDRWPTQTFSSIAATGFGLCAYVVGAERGYVTRMEAADRVLRTLKILWDLPQGNAVSGTAGHNGFFYHFLETSTALRYRNTELSTIDTGLLMAGILICQSYFDREEEAEIRELADRLYRRVDYSWMLNRENRLSMGWRPEAGFIHSDWNGYNEAMILLIQALGSPEYSIPKTIWEAWCKTYYRDQFMGYDMVNFGPLFGHQYSHIFIDFRLIRDDFMREMGLDYFENSRRATLANRDYCISRKYDQKGYHSLSWGLSACDGPGDDLRKLPAKKRTVSDLSFHGYSARGASSDYLTDDGTITPTAAGGSIPFAPEECLSALKYMWETHYDSLINEYGFKDAYNLNATFQNQRPGGWFATDMLGIDQGAILLMLANHKDGLIWNQLKKNPYIIRGLHRAGFSGGWLDDVPIPEYQQNITSMTNKEIPVDPVALFEKKVFHASNGLKLPWRLLSPRDSVNGRKYPLVIFLHGAGERGNNNHAQLKNGVMAFAEPDMRTNHPAYILAPQCPENVRWSAVDHNWYNATFTDEPTQPMSALIELLEDFISSHNDIDHYRIYVTGLSMGGFGTFDLLARQPDLFAAGIIVCAGGDTKIAPLISHIPVSIFHGATDMTVPVKMSRDMVQAIKYAGGDPEYKEFTSLGHAIWQEVFFNEQNLYWLFSKSKK
jgi:poly(3-hydroxybutyrate) depolymerase